MRRAGISEIAHAVMLPMMREEVNRNIVALQSHSIADLPALDTTALHVDAIVNRLSQNAVAQSALAGT